MPSHEASPQANERRRRLTRATRNVVTVMASEDLITQRAATTLLSAAGLSRQPALRLLATGVAGAPHAVGPTLVYNRGCVEAVAARRALTDSEIDHACPAGLFVVRRQTLPGEDLTRDWPLSPPTRIYLRWRIAQAGSFPLLVTVSGFVLSGAELLDLQVTSGDLTNLILGPPGPWFEHFQEQRVPSGPGRPWQIRGWPPRPDKAA